MESSHMPFIRPEEFWHSLGLRAEEIVVHLGCGAGYYIIPAAKIVGKIGKVYGVDILPDMLAEAENKARREKVEQTIQTVRGNLENEKGSTLPDELADWVLVANILHQSNPEKILVEAKRIMKKKGKIIVLEWDVAASPLGPPPAKRISRDTVIELAKQMGLTVSKKFVPSPYHYGIVFSL